MSSMDGPATLEYWLEESIEGKMNDCLMAELVVILEPYRNLIESRLEEYDEGRHGSWRNFRNALCLAIHPDDERKTKGAIADDLKRHKIRFLLRVLEETKGKKEKEATAIISNICKEELGDEAASKSTSHLRVLVAERHNCNTGDLPHKIPSLIRWTEAEEKNRRVKRYQILLDIIEPGKMVHIDNIFEALNEGGKLEDEEEDMLDRIFSAIDDGVLFADGDVYGRMYWACLQADEAMAELTCGCSLRRLSDDSVVLTQCEAHEKVSLLK